MLYISETHATHPNLTDGNTKWIARPALFAGWVESRKSSGRIDRRGSRAGYMLEVWSVKGLRVGE